MKSITYFLIAFIFLSCQGQHKDVPKKNNTNSAPAPKEVSNKMDVIFSAYTTAEKGLGYLKEPTENSEVLGKIDYGTKVDVVDNRNRSYFWVDDLERGSIYGKLVGIQKDSSVVYVFDGYLYHAVPGIEKHIKLIDGKLEVIHDDVVNVDSNLNMIVEKHLQTSNHLADYLLIKLETNNQIVYTHKIEHLFKNEYTLEKKNDTNQFEYFTLFDECPSREYKQTFSVIGNKILKLDDLYHEANEEE